MSLAVGSYVKADEIVARIETDKVTVDILSAHSGVITKYHSKEGDTVPVGANFMDIDTAAQAGAAQPQAAAAPKKEAAPQVSQRHAYIPLLIIIILIGRYSDASCP